MKLVAPKGAFYAHPTLEIPEDDLTFVTDLLKQKHVLVVHGSGFGEKPGTRHMRIVFLPPEPVLSAAYDAMTDFMTGAVQVKCMRHHSAHGRYSLPYPAGNR